jgi:hypothetical protein
MQDFNQSIGRSHYYVVYDGAWMIQCDGENSEPYPDRSDAFRDAVALAHLDTRNGRAADVIVQTDDHLFRPAWDSSRDIYPPPLVPEL